MKKRGWGSFKGIVSTLSVVLVTSLVAAQDINLQPNCEIYWSQHGDSLHFPWSLDGEESPSGDCLVIESWSITK